MNSAGLDARDGLMSWMRRTGKRIEALERIGRLDLLSNTIDGQSNSLTVRQLGDIPTDIPEDALVYVVDEDAEYRMDPVTRQWQATGS